MFGRACDLVEQGLAGDARRRVIAELCAGASPARALARLVLTLRTNLRDLDAQYAALDGVITFLDAQTRRDGFHVLHDWDGKAGRVNPQPIAVDVASFAAECRGDQAGHEAAGAVLLDYHYLNLLALLSLRVWDEGEPSANLDRIDRLLALLQGNGGRAHRFASRAATLILVATAHYEPDEKGYGTLLEKVHSLERRHRVDVAVDHAVAMGCHLRFGFEASYGRDVGVMRADNVADYPWLRFSIDTLLDEFGAGSDEIAEALVNGLCSDPSSFLGDASFMQRFEPHRAGLLERFERFRPDERTYSPLALFFNFSHNVVKGLVIDAALRARAWDVGVNDLFTSIPHRDRKIAAATTLMHYARHNPDRIRGRLTPVVVYDPATGRHAFGHALKALRG
ncbi:MAG TPA: hypothetical protein VFZ98_07880 [Vicinamibacterales bacterium]